MNASNNEEISVVKWKFNEYEVHITVMLFLLSVVFIKIAYHHIPYISSYVPESLILIIIGILFGVIVRYGIDQGSTKIISWKFTPEIFFNYLLPPIILESAYGLYNRTFSEYLGTVMLFAVLGTIFNFLIIGFIMYGLYIVGALGYPEITLDLSSFLLFSSLIVAIDPVAVLAIFQDIGLELNLYYIVFGESLLNDAITVVLYEIMIAFTGKENITGSQIGIGIASFFTVSFGGLLIGVVFGIMTCLITRIRSHLAVFTILLLAYFSYIMANCVGWSGIISMIACGLIQTAYAFHNVDSQTRITVHNFIRVIAEISESVIFLFLGISIISETLKWHTGYILWTLFICIIARCIVVLIMTSIVNIINIDDIKITIKEQIVLIYGGLRGAIAFSLAILIPSNILGKNGVDNQSLLVTTTLFIILFTVGIMGITMKPLVKLLHIRMEHKKIISLFQSLNDSIIDELLTGIELIINCKRRNVLRDFIKHIDEKYIRRILQNNPEYYNEKLFKIYEKISLRLHYATIRPIQSKCLLTDLPESIIHKYLMNQLTPNNNQYITIHSNNNNNNNDNDTRASNYSVNDILNTYPDDMIDNNNNTNNSNSNNEQYERIKHLLPHRNSSIINNQLGDGDRINQSINNNNNNNNTNNNNIDLQQMNSLTETMIIRNAKRKSILPNIMEQQTEFNDEFVNILLQRNRELMLKLKKQTKSKLSKRQIPITTSSSSSSSFTPPSVLPSTSISMPYEMTNNNGSLRNINNTNIILNEINEENQQQQPSQYTTQTVIHDKRHKKSI
ncbi:Sodium/hydrogen exchanger 3 [Schistosoma haematobium]|uniref:Sodium/hydrogen exchanger n=1 Tax=Schistosoma haematobium TaxID=6185 RepID=A0A6A5DN33_SCHHA|nr:Sodium/hydrogen exchanger 3 [Schistosoma haematobium]KAH9580536.1 Sodium/hydrogen exchanger 3 [Schistosoma haematobium]